MKLVSVETLPKKRASRKQLQEFIEVFVNSDADIARVDFNEREYSSAKTCCASLHKAIDRSKHPVRVIMRDGNVYLVKISSEFFDTFKEFSKEMAKDGSHDESGMPKA